MSLNSSSTMPQSPLNPDAARYLTAPPIWPPPKPSLAPPSDLEGPEERGFSDETEATTVFENDGVVYPE